MAALETILIVAVAASAISIAILKLEDVFAKLDRSRRGEEMFGEMFGVLRDPHRDS